MAIPYVQMLHINGVGVIKRRYIKYIYVCELEVFSNITNQIHNNSYDISSLPVPAENNTYLYTLTHMHGYIRIYTYINTYIRIYACPRTHTDINNKYTYLNEHGFIANEKHIKKKKILLERSSQMKSMQGLMK